jgi:hypothetical protein
MMHPGLEIVRDDDLRNLAEKREGPDVPTDPRREVLCPSRFGVRVVARSKDGPEILRADAIMRQILLLSHTRFIL